MLRFRSSQVFFFLSIFFLFQGRIKDALAKNEYGVNGISIDNVAIATEGFPGASKATSVVDKYRVTTFAPRDVKKENPEDEAEQWFDIEGLAAKINGETKTNMTSIFGDTWSKTFVKGMEESI